MFKCLAEREWHFRSCGFVGGHVLGMAKFIHLHAAEFHLSFQNGLDLDSLKHTADGKTQRACFKLSGFLSDPLSSHSGDDCRDCFWHTAQQSVTLTHNSQTYQSTLTGSGGYAITMSTQDLSLTSSTRLGCRVNKLFTLFPQMRNCNHNYLLCHTAFL